MVVLTTPRFIYTIKIGGNMFLKNKHTELYYKIIKKAKEKNYLKKSNHGYQTHHIIPRSLGGDDSKENLVVLTYKEHKKCHRLLVDMTEGDAKIKMSYAYSWFGDSAGKYKTGKDNNFSKVEIIEMVKQRMKNNNPMKQPHQRQRMKATNHRNKPVVTPKGVFISRAEALRHHGFKHWKILYDLMKKYPNDYYWKV